ncbi:FkbM family methyltransferase [Aureibacter tunicatorum]|uniref:FkbM family methyltransferase n=1 Tax=Aureibacter tunicatorum TaxID=866807 RepID=A0AAE3XPM0_9BACT|nr:FkbM family methyltransferase [Aureibacter tunicatorum]MDR6240320.1 FkbM family methyltransferase [Aureibacter tunicatorum]
MKDTEYYMKSAGYFFKRFILQKKTIKGKSDQFNLKFEFFSPDCVGREIYKKGIYEERLSNFLLNDLSFEDNDIILDIGANIGWYSSLLSSQISENVHIHSFEPDPSNFSLLQANLAHNASSNVSAHQMGVSDKTETKNLHLYKKSNGGRHSLLDINGTETVEINTISLDDFIEKNNIDPKRIKFLKMDIEGFEYFAFLGGKKALEFVPKMLVEYSPGYMRKGGIDPALCLELLESYNFEPYDIGKIGEQPQKLDRNFLLERNNNMDILWIKK